MIFAQSLGDLSCLPQHTTDVDIEVRTTNPSSNGQYIWESRALSPRRRVRARGHVPTVALHEKLFPRFGSAEVPPTVLPARHFHRFLLSRSPADNLLFDVVDRLARNRAISAFGGSSQV